MNLPLVYEKLYHAISYEMINKNRWHDIHWSRRRRIRYTSLAG